MNEKNQTNSTRRGGPSSVFSTRLPPELHTALSDKCKEDGISLAQFMRDVASAYVEGRLQITPPPNVAQPSYMRPPGNDPAD